MQSKLEDRVLCKRAWWSRNDTYVDKIVAALRLGGHGLSGKIPENMGVREPFAPRKIQSFSTPPLLSHLAMVIKPRFGMLGGSM
jgi:hypothetical protein